MPAATGYMPYDENQRIDAQVERTGRMVAGAKAEAYYDGTHKKPLLVDPGKPDLNVILNKFAERVDRRRDFLFPSLPKIELGNDSDEAATADEEWLKLAWQENGGTPTAALMVKDGSLYGQVYARIQPAAGRRKYPRISLLNNVITFWKSDDVDIPLWHEVQWMVGKALYRQDILDEVALGTGDGYEILEYQALVGEPEVKPDDWALMRWTRWPYQSAPIISWQHWPKARSWYGGSEAGDLDLNDSLNRVLSQANAVVRSHAFPKTVATGVTASKTIVPTAIDSLWTVESEQAKVYNLEMKSDLTAIMNLAGILKDGYQSQGRVVILNGQPVDFARINNLALRMIFQDMLAANKTLRNQYGAALIAISLAMLELGGQKCDYQPKLGWDEPLPVNDLEQLQVVQGETGMGILSKESAAAEMGLDWQEEQDRMADEADGRGAMFERYLNTGGSNPFPPNQQQQQPPDEAMQQ